MRLPTTRSLAIIVTSVHGASPEREGVECPRAQFRHGDQQTRGEIESMQSTAG
jgi:hypothetical protein